MKKFSIPYGKSETSFYLNESELVEIILPPVTQSLSKNILSEKIETALSNPIEAPSLDTFHGVKTVGIAINDKTRPVPYHLLLPPLLNRLEKMGIPPSSIQFFIATGTHLPMSSDEFSRILSSEIVDRYRIVSHNCDDDANLIHLGRTSRSTEIVVNRAFYESELKIVTGNIEPHHFAGFSGGYKTASIGLGARSSINHNHAMLTDPYSTIGVYEENPLRQDIEEIGEGIGVQYALNFILSGEHEVADVLFGNPQAVLQKGIPIARQICQTPVKGLYDLVIASAGGHPKDINLYQAQKAMTHASLITRPGGTIILAAACPEGSGSASYEAYLQGIHSHEEVLQKFRRDGFQVGPHKSFQIARIALQYNLILASEMQPEKVVSLLLEPASSVQSAVERALLKMPANPRIAVLPHATSTIPVVLQE